uniref:Uncharacterized protein n=1 Tax=Mimivirus LCMiAC02 TaxID=2506609 RepID=A0A481Z184_9VIRU|nr:MAG: hypothetical protein LCMiAC02_02830 [Mimivirus LCMiAC02]
MYKHISPWILIFIIFRVILSDSYTATIDLGTEKISKIYPQFINDNFASVYFNCEQYQQVNKIVSKCAYNESSEIICHQPRIKVSGICNFPCEMYITKENSITNNTFEPVNILKQIIAVKVTNKNYFQFIAPIYKTNFYVYVINLNLERDNKLTITYNCTNPKTPPPVYYWPVWFIVLFTIGYGSIFLYLIIILVGSLICLMISACYFRKQEKLIREM